MQRKSSDWPYTIPEATGHPVARTYELKHAILVRLVTLAKGRLRRDCFPRKTSCVQKLSAPF